MSTNNVWIFSRLFLSSTCLFSFYKKIEKILTSNSPYYWCLFQQLISLLMPRCVFSSWFPWNWQIFNKVNQLEKRWIAHHLFTWSIYSVSLMKTWITIAMNKFRWIFVRLFFKILFSIKERCFAWANFNKWLASNKENLTENDKKSQVKWWGKWTRRWDPKIRESEFALLFEALTGNVEQKENFTWNLIRKKSILAQNLTSLSSPNCSKSFLNSGK